MKILIVLVISAIFANSDAAGRRRTTSSTTPSPPDLEQTLAEREASLLDREEQFRAREAAFRLREETLSKREDQFKDREEKLSKREKNIALREQNTLRGGTCLSEAESLPPDYSLVRLDPDSNKLLDIGEISACSDNMRFFATPDNETSGRCDCDYHQCSRPLLYSDKYKQCFWAWSQGPCEQKEWYVLDDTYSPVCEPNPCPESPVVGTPSYYFKSPEDNKCYKAGSKGPCKKKGERLFIVPEDPVPKCRSQALCPAQSIPAVQRCIPGNRRYFDGLCHNDKSDHDDASEDEGNE